jgi:hypothetical protein
MDGLEPQVEEAVAGLGQFFLEQIPQVVEAGVDAVGQQLQSVQGSGEKSAEQLSAELQMLMNKYKQMMDLLSNMLKSMHDTQMEIIRNIRG